jgi:hypothetical protein
MFYAIFSALKSEEISTLIFGVVSILKLFIFLEEALLLGRGGSLLNEFYVYWVLLCNETVLLLITLSATRHIPSMNSIKYIWQCLSELISST